MSEEKKSFVKVKCSDCGNEQIVFRKPTSEVSCQVCGSPLAEPTGGYAEFKGELIEEVG